MGMEVPEAVEGWLAEELADFVVGVLGPAAEVTEPVIGKDGLAG